MEKQDFKDLVKEALQEEIKPFYVDREVHYQHHQFLTEMMDWSNKFKSGIISTVAKGVVLLMFGLMLLGFIFWGKGHFK